jgi:hypothetical protein
MTRTGLGSLVTIIVLTTATTVVAQEETEESDDEARARMLYERGNSAFLAGEYDAAIEAFRESYELSGRPQLLYNMGTVYDRQRNDPRALEMFERYLEAEPTSEISDEVRARVRVLHERLEEGEDTEDTEGTEDTRVAEDTRDTEEAGGEPVESSGGGGRLATWIVGGLALALAGGAIATGVVANDKYGELENGCGAMGGCTDAQIDDSGVETLALVTNVLWGVAGAAAIAAVVLFFVEGGNDDDDQREMAIGIGPGSVQIRGSF